MKPRTENRYPTAAPDVRPKCAILGFTDSRAETPYGDPEFEVWGLNELYRMPDIEAQTLQKFHRWFEIHDRRVLAEEKGVPPKWPPHLESLARFPIPVYMQKHHDDIPPSVPYPKADVEQVCAEGALMWPNGNPYFTSSIAWMIGLAIAEGFEEIHVYGVDMANDTEWAGERPCCEYMLGLAQGRGAHTYVPRTSDLLKSVGQYGWAEGTSEFRAKLNEREKWLESQKGQFQAQLQALDNQRAGIIANINQVQGAIQDVVYWKRSWSVNNDVNPAQPFMDRSKDPRAMVDGKPPVNRILEESKTE